MKFMRIYFPFFFALLFANRFYGIPAYPHKIPVQTDWGIAYIQLYGDEYLKHAETLDGYTLFQQEDCWYYAELDTDGSLKASSFKLGDFSNAGIDSFLNRTPKHLKASEIPSPHGSLISSQTVRKIKDATGDRKILVILMQFTDVQFVKTEYDFDQLFNGINYTEDSARGSVHDYYAGVSYGKLQLLCDIVGPFTSKHPREYYGKNGRDGQDQNPVALFEEAMEYASQQIRLNEYDVDNDGYLDNVHIVFAGHGEEAGAPSSAIWSHELTFRQGYSYQDVLVDRYSCAPELRGNSGEGISRIGPHCHEIGHALGAMDFYDTNNEKGGYFEGTGCWDIMASGSWNEEGVLPADFNPYVKMVDFGWVEIPELPLGQVTIQPSYESEHNYYLLSNAPNDYYLLENRTTDNWGEGLPGEGLLIFHIHPNIASSGNDINSSFPQKCYPVCASSNISLPSSTSSSYGSINSAGCPFPGSTGNQTFSFASTPAAFCWNGAQCHISITNIHKESDGSISLYNQSSTSEMASGDILMQEDFESSKSFEMISHSGSVSWNQRIFSIYDYEKGMTTPHGGNGYLRFAPNKNAIGLQENTIVFQTLKAKEENEAILSFYFSGSNYRPEADMLSITFSYDGNESCDTVNIRSNLSGWNNYMQELPIAKSYCIYIRGKATYGQSIFIDDVEVIQKRMAGIKERDLPTVKKDSIVGVYNLFGNKIESVGKGLNIIRQKDGTVKKVFVK